ncbi:short-chain dehydrogenase/reductase SDR [Pseudomonas syringae pv. theae ICMP 3923]|uniref:Short-chain dehydrogenase/reductase SDR n=1 Tax=Pseudomonas syringae pv. theae TaxID=103985 RepID=A0A0Q0L155_PSESX|nr:SDR family oxidoreductase [Pseudomonas syringae]EPM67338.1 short-chain dehydrogenase/reductase SDR [Pseudomonas syringae pv. theae ICMP 3923]KPZ34622.1 hypothetical protein AN901_200627 [Pseudomonas syringae pv. theae]MBL3831485.1 SDR family oxidoreductase [Pseudomonas syringae pv. theae]MBL3837321.1 SDR family oxidoreductase [Pseudomonas syringae pv. theae]MBL3870527.1 SDR family oxidoreductase [Pseudomonas syringae pv. theae]
MVKNASERYAFIAASSQGLGFAIAKSLALNGYRVIINGRKSEALDAAKKIIVAAGGSVDVFQGDITESGTPVALMERYGQVDVLVTNCAGPSPIAFQALTAADLLSAFHNNTVSMLALIQQVLPGMQRRGFGRIVNLLSSSMIRPIAGLDASAAARMALATALRSVSREAISDGVTINNILPGPIMTARTAAYVASQSASTQRASNEVMTALTESIPAKRLGTPDEVGALCAYLCSADSGFITGQNICIDGGLTL